MGKYNQVKGHRSGETKVFFFFKKKGEKGEIFRSTVCWVPRYFFQIHLPSYLSHSSSPKSSLFLNSFFPKIHISHDLCSVILVLNFPLTKRSFRASPLPWACSQQWCMSFPLYTCAIFSHVTEYSTLTVESPDLSTDLHSVTSNRTEIFCFSHY